jgi:hypothetical protein
MTIRVCLKSIISSCKTVNATVHSAAITDMAIDDDECRYLLAGAYDGTLYIHDLGEPWGKSGSLEAKAVVHIGRSHRHAHKKSVECVQWYPAVNLLRQHFPYY